jgi:hypothetical protein
MALGQAQSSEVGGRESAVGGAAQTDVGVGET